MAEKEQGYLLGRNEVQALRDMYTDWRRSKGRGRWKTNYEIKGGKRETIVKVTNVHPDSPGDSSTPHVFQGDEYANGTGNDIDNTDATKTGVTVFLMGIPDGVKVYPTTPLVAYKKRQKWTDSNGDEQTEVVYEARWFAPNQVWEATADESSGTIDAEALNKDGSTTGNTITFDTLAD